MEYTSDLSSDAERIESSNLSAPTIYGPYTRKDGRKHIVLVYADGTKTSKSWPKHLMEIKLGRLLESYETVDHIDGDRTNDDYSNLQILTRSENAKKSAFVVSGTFPCCWCGKEFKLSVNQRTKRKGKTLNRFCSKSCSGKYGKSVQQHGSYITTDEIPINYINSQGNTAARVLV